VIRALLRAASLVPYALFLFLILAPAGALAYAAASLAGAVWAAVRQGWNDHK
jgi:hypothetical protein